MDIKDFIQKRSLSYSEEQTLQRYEDFVSKTIVYPRGKKHLSDINCSLISENGQCQSPLFITILDVPNEIRWECSSCGSCGIIKNWRLSHSCSNYIKTQQNEKSSLQKEIILSEQEFYEILTMAADFSELAELIKIAHKSSEGFVICPEDIASLQILTSLALRLEIDPKIPSVICKLKEEIKSYFAKRASFTEAPLLS